MLAFSQTVYDWMKLIHILAAIVWVGGGFFIQVYAGRLVAAGEMARAATFSKDVEKLGTRIFLPASVVVLVMGISMTIYAPFIELTDAWIIIGLFGIASTIAFGSLFLGPEAGRLGRLLDERGVEDAEVQARIKRLFMVSKIDLSVIVLVVVAMVLKPGS